MNVSTIKPRERVHAVVNLNSEDFYWVFSAEEKAKDKFIAIEAIVCNEERHNSDNYDESVYVLDGGDYGVFEAPANHLFKTKSEANIFLRECEREKAIHLFKESSTINGLLRFLVETNSIRIPSDPIARNVLYTHLEDAGLGDRIPLYELASV